MLFEHLRFAGHHIEIIGNYDSRVAPGAGVLAVAVGNARVDIAVSAALALGIAHILHPFEEE